MKKLTVLLIHLYLKWNPMIAIHNRTFSVNQIREQLCNQVFATLANIWLWMDVLQKFVKLY